MAQTGRGTAGRRGGRPPGGGSGNLLWIGLLALVVVLGVVAVVATAGSDDDGTDGLEQVQPVEVAGEPLSLLEDPASDPAAGQLMPDLTGRRFGGEPIAITNDGTPKVVLFLAHWCPHCRREVPVVQDWLDSEGPPEGVDLYSVATATTESRPNYPPSAWLDDEGWELPVLADSAEGTAAAAAGVGGYPFFVAVDAEGAVVARASGAIGAEGVERLVDLARG